MSELQTELVWDGPKKFIPGYGMVYPGKIKRLPEFLAADYAKQNLGHKASPEEIKAEVAAAAEDIEQEVAAATEEEAADPDKVVSIDRKRGGKPKPEEGA